ncbi:MAG: hypothetical protein LBG31_06940 [Prevotellaceae bacterium]|nr:hypothetical protein [Prevotellaceae bacterium]
MTKRPRHFDRSARGTSARSGEIPYPTQGDAKQWVQDAGDSSTSLRSARNDGRMESGEWRVESGE